MENCTNKVVDGKTTLRDNIIKLKNQAIRQHYSCADSWYSCRKDKDSPSYTEDGSSSCTCGADDHNEKIKGLFNDIIKALDREEYEMESVENTEQLYYCFKDKIINRGTSCPHCVKVTAVEAEIIQSRMDSINEFVQDLTGRGTI